MFKSIDKVLECPECKNKINLEKDYNVDDVIECQFCGIELEVVGLDENKNVDVEILEEEK